MAKRFCEPNSIPTFRRIHLIGIFDIEHLKKELDELAEELKIVESRNSYQGSWQVNIDPNLYTEKTQGEMSGSDVFPRREWNVYGTLGLFLEKIYRINVHIESFRNGIHIKFIPGGDRKDFSPKIKKGVFGDVNQDYAFTKNFYDVATIVGDVLKEFKKYHSITGGEDD
jgi:hypothetical protein